MNDAYFERCSDLCKRCAGVGKVWSGIYYAAVLCLVCGGTGWVRREA